MNKKTIRITESGLRKLIKESVRKILNEANDTYGGMYDNALYYSKTPEEWDERMKDRKEYADVNASLAKHKHPQATPYKKYNPNDEGSFIASLWAQTGNPKNDDDFKKNLERDRNVYGF